MPALNIRPSRPVAAALGALTLACAPHALSAATQPAARAATKAPAKTPAKVAAKAPAKPAAPNWGAKVTVTPNGSMLLGNPAAKVRLTEYVSYTCSHCAHFNKELELPLRKGLVPRGEVAVTVSNYLRNPVDLTIAMLTACGSPAGFPRRHDTFFATQEQWIGRAQNLTPAQMERWQQGTEIDRMRAIAADFGFYDMVKAWGLTHAQADACLANKVTRDRIDAQQAEAAGFGINSTPSFVLNGKVLAVHDWPSVSAAIDAARSPARNGG